MYNKEEYMLRKSLGNDLFDLFKKHNCILAGGAITSIFSGNPIKDYDLYFHSKESFTALQQELDYGSCTFSAFLKPGEVKLLNKSENAITLSVEGKILQLIQIEELMGLEASELIKQFDFTVCMCAYDFKNNTFVFAEDFLKHLAQRVLVYNPNSKYPFASLYRTIKYTKKGFRINGIDMVKLGLKCNSILINNYKELRKQLMGIDTLFLKGLTDNLNSQEMAEQLYSFDKFLEMMDEYLSKFSEFEEKE